MHGFPAYAKNSELPMQFWEPSYSDEIFQTLNGFWSPLCYKKTLQSAAERFTITSNLNSENFACFLQKSNMTESIVQTSRYLSEEVLDQKEEKLSSSSSTVSYVPAKLLFEFSKDILIEHNRELNVSFVVKQNTLTKKYHISAYSGANFSHSIWLFNNEYERITKIASKNDRLIVETSHKLSLFGLS